jgi:hypothetical protein
MKKAMQAMVREFSNTGGFMTKPRSRFLPQPKRLQSAYLDMNRRYCAECDTATLAFYATQGGKADITYSGHDLDRVRADFLAESAVHWALAESAKDHGDGLPYTRSTHANDSWNRLPDRTSDGSRNPRKLDRSRMVPPYPGKPYETTEGWVGTRNSGKAASVAGAAEEEMEFMVWFPNDTTMRITRRGKADHAVSMVKFQANLKDVLVGP